MKSAATPVIHCRNCGERLAVPAASATGKLRCSCGVFNDIPPTDPNAKPSAPQAPSRAHRAPDAPSLSELLHEPPSSQGAPAGRDDGALPTAQPESAPPRASEAAAEPEREILLHGTNDENDFNPYPVRGDAPMKPCPGCGRRLDLRAKLCVGCGFDLQAERKTKRAYEPIDQTWENGWPLRKRLRVFIILQAINASLILITAFTNFAAGFTLGAAVPTALLQAFLLGTYDRLRLTRNSKGQVALTRTWRFAFLNRPTETVRWQEHVSIRIVNLHETDMMDWAVFVILLGYLIVPGVLFLRYAILPDKLDVILCKEHDAAGWTILRSADEALVKEIVKRISELTRLPVHG